MAEEPVSTLLVVDASTLFRDGLVQMLAHSAHRLLPSRASLQGVEPLLAEQDRPLLLVGYDGTGEALGRRLAELRAAAPALRIALICDDADLPEVGRTCAFAADSILTKAICSARLVRILDLTLLGQRVLPNDWTVRVFASGIGPLAGATDRPEAELTARERTIARCLADGLSNKLIARRLGIAETTVKVHVRALLRKLGASNRTQAAVWAVERLPAPANADAIAHAPTAVERPAIVLQ